MCGCDALACAPEVECDDVGMGTRDWRSKLAVQSAASRFSVLQFKWDRFAAQLHMLALAAGQVLAMMGSTS